MEANIARHALDRTPLSLIIDDSTVLLNLNYFFLREQEAVFGRPQRWQDVPVVHPESFTREFAEWCLASGVRGKFSIVPCPAGVGRIDRDLPLVSRAQQQSWLAMCRELIMPAFDITPEMITHTYVADLKTLAPVKPDLWEQWGWDNLPVEQEDLIVDYITLACRILQNAGLTPAGVTSPGGFGNPIDVYARCAEKAVRAVTGNPLPYLFKRVSKDRVDTPVWYPDRAAGTAMGEIIACAGDWTGSWTGYGEVDPDRYITADLAGGRLPEVLDAGDPAVLISHWQGFYGMHDGDRRGFRTLQTVVERLRQRDPHGERTCWRRCGEITAYACARELARVEVRPGGVELDLPAVVPELTLEIRGADVRGITVNGAPLKSAGSRRALRSGTFLAETDRVLVAFDPPGRHVRVEVSGPGAGEAGRNPSI